MYIRPSGVIKCSLEYDALQPTQDQLTYCTCIVHACLNSRRKLDDQPLPVCRERTLLRDVSHTVLAGQTAARYYGLLGTFQALEVHIRGQRYEYELSSVLPRGRGRGGHQAWL